MKFNDFVLGPLQQGFIDQYAAGRSMAGLPIHLTEAPLGPNRLFLQQATLCGLPVVTLACDPSFLTEELCQGCLITAVQNGRRWSCANLLVIGDYFLACQRLEGHEPLDHGCGLPAELGGGYLDWDQSSQVLTTNRARFFKNRQIMLPASIKVRQAMQQLDLVEPKKEPSPRSVRPRMRWDSRFADVQPNERYL